MEDFTKLEVAAMLAAVRAVKQSAPKDLVALAEAVTGGHPLSTAEAKLETMLKEFACARD